MFEQTGDRETKHIKARKTENRMEKASNRQTKLYISNKQTSKITVLPTSLSRSNLTVYATY